jgi:hypothetical protein
VDPESKKLLEETFSLAQDNNKILHAMRRSMRWANVMTTIYWLLIIGTAVGAFYFLQPYINQVVKTYGSVSAALKNFKQ